jgi:hypothetical protein
MDTGQAIIHCCLLGAKALHVFSGMPRMPVYREEQVQVSVLTGFEWFSFFTPGTYFTISYDIYHRLLLVLFSIPPVHVAILQHKVTYAL